MAKEKQKQKDEKEVEQDKTIKTGVRQFNEDMLKKILIQQNYVSEEDLKKAETVIKKRRMPLMDYLISQDILTPDLIGQAIAEYFNVPYADLNSLMPPAEQIKKIPEEIAKRFNVVLFRDEGKTLIVTTDNPKQKKLLSAMKAIFKGAKIEVHFSLPEDIAEVLRIYRKALKTQFSQIIKTSEQVAPDLIDTIFEDALILKASDVHFEPLEREVVVRFRVDGVLQEAGRLPKEYYENILNRIKVLALMRIDEHYAAQDGAIRYKMEDQTVDMRVSIVPIVYGEKIVIRMLAQYIKAFSLEDLGFSPKAQEIIQAAAKKPFGMLLVTGPTGSGKTTTLYGLLKYLHNPEVNITTIEDPVEYRIAGINQIQVNKATELTFAKGLRSIVRQDPDIILVGEIRDRETAEISINAALTGHLLLSTFHANDSASTIPRMLDMGIEPFLLSSTIEVVIAQRLIRKVCEHCRVSVSTTQASLPKDYIDAKPFFPKTKFNLYKGKGCAMCHNTGYKGRTAVFEIIQYTPELKDLLLKNPSSKEIWDVATKQGAQTLFEDGIEKVKKGITTLEELFRVAEPPSRRRLY